MLLVFAYLPFCYSRCTTTSRTAAEFWPVFQVLCPHNSNVFEQGSMSPFQPYTSSSMYIIHTFDLTHPPALIEENVEMGDCDVLERPFHELSPPMSLTTLEEELQPSRTVSTALILFATDLPLLRNNTQREQLEILENKCSQNCTHSGLTSGPIRRIENYEVPLDGMANHSLLKSSSSML